ncbi:MAG: hypothetical protein A2297_09915 [Elusimicrobia bacterium RIFOXYB2_FULL_48_7]|nr:MAG: hypothetical protein A2297_09915 [Elusimicrobia bacterium RIFOXYB2_FULL_48_7]
MDKVRIGLVGCGGMGQKHIEYAGQLTNCEVTAVSDVHCDTAKAVGEKHGVKYFTDYNELINSKLVDAVIVATPHYFHPEVAIAALKKGLHVLCEKPIAVNVSAADKMIKAAKKSKKVFGVMYQERALAAIRKAREIVENGEIGEIRRTLMIEPNYRSQAYYDSGSWRGTWKGEGGGVLMNQAPHGIDLFMILGGLPCKVQARTRTKLHKIEVEDEADAQLYYPNGAWGYYYTTTNEMAGEKYKTARIEVCGDKALMIYSGGELRLLKFKPSITEHNKTNTQVWNAPEVEEVKIELQPAEKGHKEIIRNFCATILGQEKLIAPGEQGLMSVEFIDALILSGKTGKPVEIPVKRSKYDKMLEKLKASGIVKVVKNAVRQTDTNIK